ncbi:hypothetical protein NE619_00505 [Anaerovorax odorimutans]|uniref:CcmD family protein n=1 Tax=Anaerovorax odorimutans TaxID=109327 RepID=A0ABT1RJ58_9FIRM|nr:hypothetical protein [Anaerovorax odorimutans]MCQ4635213.1 hypothetical protein [Anaerovorax odorimutans]
MAKKAWTLYAVIGAVMILFTAICPAIAAAESTGGQVPVYLRQTASSREAGGAIDTVVTESGAQGTDERVRAVVTGDEWMKIPLLLLCAAAFIVSCFLIIDIRQRRSVAETMEMLIKEEDKNEKENS